MKKSVLGGAARVALACACLIPAAGRAEVAMSLSSAIGPGAPAPADAKPLEISAYLDAYYAYGFNRVAPAAPATSPAAPMPAGGINLHSYDFYTRQLGLGLAELTVRHVRKETALLIDFDFGQTADFAAATYSVSGSGGPSVSFVDEVSKHVGQAVLSYTPSSAPRLLLEIGKLPTHVGYECLKPRDNWNYSRSLTFSFATPLWHTGLHAAYALVQDRLAAGIYLYNGWNTIYDANSQPTWGAQLKWTPSENTTLIYNYVGGPEQPGNNSDWRQVHELTVTQSLTPLASVAADLVAGRESHPAGTSLDVATWWAAELLARYQATTIYSLSPRFELYNDPSGYTMGGGPQTALSATLTNAFQVSDGLETRLELRWDHSSADTRFMTRDGFSGNQVSTVLGILYRT